MDDLEKHYYKLSLTLLSSIGLWPGESKILLNAVYSFILIFGLIIQILPFITMGFSKALVLTNVPTITFGIGGCLKYFSFIFQKTDIKEIRELVKRDWSTAKDDQEAKIIMHYADEGKFRVTAFAKLIYAALVVFVFSQYTPCLINFIAPLNESRSVIQFTTIEIFLDREKYAVLNVLVFDVVRIVLIMVYVATEIIYVMWQGHQESQIEIYAYRIRKIFLGDPVEMHVSDKNSRIIKMIASAVDMHDRVILFNDYMNRFSWSYFLLVCLGVLSMAVTLYRFSVALRTLDNFEELAMCLTIYIPLVIYLYFGNYMRQRLVNSYDNLFDAIYDTNWYAATVRTQKMLLLVILRNVQPLNGKAYGVYTMSMETFVAVMKLTFSYYMLLHSVE